MSESIIHTEQLCRSFGTIKAVDGLSMDVPAGIVFGFLGPNGSGKTTTIHLLLGLLEPTQGKARVMGFDTRSQADEIRKKCGALLEFSGLYERMSAEDNLDLYGRIYCMSGPERKARVKELLTHLDLWDRRKEKVGNWSRGMKQKIAIARALFHHPPLVFLDEPTAGLDPVAAAALHADLTSLVANEGVTVFLNTHNLAEAEKLCAQIGVIRKGKLLALGSPDELRLRNGGYKVEIVGKGFNEKTLTLLQSRPEVKQAEFQNDRLIIELNGENKIGPLVTLIVQSGGRSRGYLQERGESGGSVFEVDAGGKSVNDLWTMIWKEWKDFLWSGGRSDLLRPLLNIAVLGIILPLSFGQGWIDLDPAPVLIVLFVPFMFVIIIISDAIAGERERHTLETLLASRVSDRAILLSKVLVTVGYNWAMTLFCLLIGAAVVNLSQRPGQWEFYKPLSLFVVVLVLCFLTTLLAASGGVLISLKSVTVRQASQTMLLGLIILGLAITTVVRLLPPGLTASLTTPQMVLIIMLVLVVLDAILLVASLLSFQRSRLILS